MILIDGNTYLNEEQADNLRKALNREPQGKKVFASWVIDGALCSMKKEQIDNALLDTDLKINWSRINIR